MKKRSATRRPTLASLAADLGVARSTVSNAYNRPDQLSPELRERILERAKELSYPGPNAAARRLLDTSLTTVGVIFSERFTYPFVDPAARAFMEGLGVVAEQHQLGVLLIPAPVRGPSARTALENAVLDALIVYSMPDDDDVLNAALARHVPTVVVDQPHLPDLAHVKLDDRGGARAAMEHVLGLGHRDVAVVTWRLGRDERSGPADEVRQREAIYAIARERLRGYRDAVENAGMEWESIRVVEQPEHRYEDGLAAGLSLLGAPDRPSAIIAFSDVLALGVMDAAESLGINIPRELTVVGFDDNDQALGRGLTTVRQPLRDKGERVGRLLLRMWETGDLDPEPETIPTELVVRGSSGAARRH